ncbi:unnamed protein product [Schistocephalus solidus]|uniref:Short-chain dehydrogenase/reductase SDR n=1 Tax=Schistocephalus solidus TaxID=70667 RepID=A0A183SH24_SCHSO|nr:unnamed protein product [Schistocephalus solidus]
MCIQIDVVVNAVCAGMPSFEEFSRRLGVSNDDHFGCVPIELVVAVHGVRKHKRQRTASADGQFIFIYASPKSSTCMAYVSAGAICTWNAIKEIRLLLFYYEVFNSE